MVSGNCDKLVSAAFLISLLFYFVLEFLLFIVGF